MIEFVGLVKSDLAALYGYAKWTALLTNPSATAALVIRLATRMPRALRPLARMVGVLFFGVDVAAHARIGAGVRLPHPVGIVIGDGVEIGSNATIYQCVTLGSLRGGYPKIGSDVFLYPSAVVVGAIFVGDGAKIGALTYVDKDVAPGAVVKRDS
ncbi:hypothetical protein [Arenimonas sp.]|uniref:serine O-acetyltransferase n=1 Tax=Arenimonas sp. TaxID=1872635 RepID=UPI002E2F533F|nr:hypothetical protein [Arenimonas sp.]HEX4854374.1 hypothetical protein [Arenimonas sp.]